MKNVLILTLLLAISAAAQTKLGSEAEGYSFTVPRGWLSESSAEGFVVGNAAKTIVIAVKGHTYSNFQAFANDLHLERDGLTLVGEPQAITGGYHFRTTKDGLIIDTFVVFSPDGRGAMAVALAKGQEALTAFNTANAIANSFLFTKPKVSAAAGQVRNVLAGKHLMFLYTASGYSERKDIYLCSSGTFYQSTNMGGFSPGDVGGPSFGARGGKSGVWSISPNGQKLILRFQQGSTAEYQLTARQASNEIGMNGQRWFVKTQEQCR